MGSSGTTAAAVPWKSDGVVVYGSEESRCWIFLVSHKRELPAGKMGLEQKIKNLEHAIGGPECRQTTHEDEAKVRIWESSYIWLVLRACLVYQSIE